MATKRSSPTDAFKEALKTKESTRAILEAAGIVAEYGMTVTDTGPVVDVRIPAKSWAAAQSALPFTIGSATVRIIKK